MFSNLPSIDNHFPNGHPLFGRPDGSPQKSNSAADPEAGTEPPSEPSAGPSPVKRYLTESDDDPLIVRGILSPVPTAKSFAAEYQIRYSSGTKAFHRYITEEGISAPISDDEVVTLEADFVKRLAIERNALKLLVARSEAMLKSIRALIKGLAPLGPPPDANRKLLAVEDGVLDLSTHEPHLLPHSPEYNFTTKIPFKYVPKAKCDRFIKMICRLLPDPSDQALLQRALGALLLPGNAAQRIYIFWGTGGTGKSVLMTILETILGWARFAYLRTDRLSDRFETHAYQGKSILVGKDVGPDYLSHKSAPLIKALVGHDRMEAERKYGGRAALVGNFFVIVITNHQLRIVASEDEKAWGRRSLPFHFSSSPPDKIINNFAQILLDEEGSGILNWLIAGCIEHQAELAEHGDFVLTEAQQERIDDMIMRSQSPEHFVTDYITAGKGTLTTEEIHDEYERLCAEKRWVPVSEQQFKTALPKLMSKHHGALKRHDIFKYSRIQRGFTGVCFVVPEAPATPIPSTLQ